MTLPSILTSETRANNFVLSQPIIPAVIIRNSQSIWITCDTYVCHGSLQSSPYLTAETSHTCLSSHGEDLRVLRILTADITHFSLMICANITCLSRCKWAASLKREKLIVMFYLVSELFGMVDTFFTQAYFPRLTAKLPVPQVLLQPPCLLAHACHVGPSPRIKDKSQPLWLLHFI